MRALQAIAALLLATVAAAGCKEQLSDPDSTPPQSLGLQWSSVPEEPPRYPGAPELHPGLDEAVDQGLNGQGGERTALEKNLSLLGFLDLGISGDVWALGNFAYVGGFGLGASVKVVDISDPTNPQLIRTLPTSGFSSPLDVKAERINTRHFHGDLLAVANDGPPGESGIQLWDVSDPTNPDLLSDPRVGPVHNLYLYQKGNRAFVLLAISFAEVFSGPDPFNPLIGDFVIVEVTDPRNPQIISDWGAGKDGGLPFGFGNLCDPAVCRGSSPFAFLHDVWANPQGTVAYLSYWDLGLILLDISDPTNPTLIGRGIEPATFGSDEGNAHNAVFAQGGNLVIVGDEDFTPDPWGFLRVFDTQDAANPVQIGAFATDGVFDSPNPATMHNIIVRGSRAYLSWYFEGIRVVDISQPADPREIAAFLPPAGTGPGLFWGVYVHKDLILASDLLSGLFILKQKP